MTVQLLDPPAADDAALVAHLTGLINDVYATAERGLWVDGATRTTPSVLAELIRAGEIAVATRDAEVVGSIRLHDVTADISELGILVAAPDRRGTGVGCALVDFAEGRARERGMTTMQLELLVPRGWSHPSKEFLKDWYGRRGYHVVRTGVIEDAHPQLAPLLACACDLEVRQKPLGDAG